MKQSTKLIGFREIPSFLLKSIKSVYSVHNFRTVSAEYFNVCLVRVELYWRTCPLGLLLSSNVLMKCAYTSSKVHSFVLYFGCCWADFAKNSKNNARFFDKSIFLRHQCLLHKITSSKLLARALQPIACVLGCDYFFNFIQFVLTDCIVNNDLSIWTFDNRKINSKTTISQVLTYLMF